MTDEDAGKPLGSGVRRGRPTRVEAHLESAEYKRERLRDLTGIEDEQKLFDIFYRLQDLLIKIGFANIAYRKNTVDGRENTETEFALSNLDSEKFIELEAVLKELRIFGFPEAIPNSNYTTLVIENKRDLEVLRLMSVFKDLDTRRGEEERKKRDEEAEKARREQIEAEARAYADRMREEAERRIAELGAKAREEAERAMREAAERVERERIIELERKWEEEKRELAEKRARDRKVLEETVAALLAQIEPQKFELDVEIASVPDPLKEVTKFRGFQPPVPNVYRKRIGDATPNLEEMQSLLGEIDPIEVDTWAKRYETLWNDGRLIDLEQEPIQLKGGFVDLSLFPKRFVWRAEKGKTRKKCYEYNPETRQIGREITKTEREAYILRLGEVRKKRREEEEAQNKELPKSREEIELEQKVVLLTNNLIVWLINDLTSNLRGNIELRKIRQNDADELYQSAIVGLMYAVDHFDPNRPDSNLTAFMLSRMEGAVRQIFSEQHGYAPQKEHIRVPLDVLEKRRKFRKAERALRSLNSAESDQYKMQMLLVQALSQPEVGLLKEDSTLADLLALRERLLMDYEEIPVSAFIDEDGEPDTELAKLSAFLQTPPLQQEDTERRAMIEAVNHTLSTLTPREERVIRARFFPPKGEDQKKFISHALDTHDGLSLDEIARQFSVTRNRVAQIEAKALRKLKHPSRSRKLRSFIE